MKRLIKFSLVRKALKQIKKPDNENGKQKTLLSFIRECERTLLMEAEFNCQYIERKRHECIVTLAVYLSAHHLVEKEKLYGFKEVERKYRKTLTRVWSEYRALAERPASDGKVTFWIDTVRVKFLLGQEI